LATDGETARPGVLVSQAVDCEKRLVIVWPNVNNTR